MKKGNNWRSNLGNKIYRNILIDAYKSIYISIPKNGCTTIKQHLLNNYISDHNYEGPIHDYDFPFATHYQLNTEYDSFMKFTFVRNPWSRVVSCNKNKIRAPQFSNEYFSNGIHNGFRNSMVYFLET